MKKTAGLFFAFLLFSLFAMDQELHRRWDEITANEWPKDLTMSGKTCILPVGILEKHGPHLSLLSSR
jgi:creatinine amidohydrolase